MKEFCISKNYHSNSISPQNLHKKEHVTRPDEWMMDVLRLIKEG
jgi:hypothetical protein